MSALRPGPALPQPSRERTLRSVRLRVWPVRMRPLRDQGRTAGGVRDRRRAGCAGIPARAGGIAGDGDLDASAPGRAELLAEIQRAQGIRAAARRDLAEGTIDRVDWLDIRQRTEDNIAKARREYDRLSGLATVMSDIPPSERVRDAWESWNVDRKRAAIKAVLHRVIINPRPGGRAEQPRRKAQGPGHTPRTRNGDPAAAGRIRLARLGIAPHGKRRRR